MRISSHTIRPSFSNLFHIVETKTGMGATNCKFTSLRSLFIPTKISFSPKWLSFSSWNIVEGDQEDSHAKRIAEFAVDMVHEASQILVDDEDPGKGYINIRVGFHSGPVVSNVIGSLNPRYGLFGDTGK